MRWVEQLDFEQSACLFEGLCDLVILARSYDMALRMVMVDNECGRIRELRVEDFMESETIVEKDSARTEWNPMI